MATGLIMRDMEVVVEAVVGAAVGYFSLRSGLIRSGSSGIDIWIVSVDGSPGYYSWA